MGREVDKSITTTCKHCGRQIDNGEEVLYIEGLPGLFCFECVDIEEVTHYTINGDLIADEDNASTGRIVYD